MSLYSYHIDEYLDVTYKSGGNYNQEALNNIYKVLRSPDGQLIPIDIHLIDIIDHIQDHYGARTIEVISGYRSPEYNKKLKLEGKNVADESLHMEGIAIDIHIDEVRENALKEYALNLGCGGVGYYPENDFVHIDVGPQRNWSKPENGRTIVGMNNNQSPHTAITDKNDYLPDEKMKIEFTNKGTSELGLNACSEVETFNKGRWEKIGKTAILLPKDRINPNETVNILWSMEPSVCNSKTKLKLPHGRMRLVFKENPKPNQSILSNEFYLKKF